MRILHLSIGSLPTVFGMRGGAIQRRVGETAREQARRGHDVLVISPAERSGQRHIAGVEVRDLRCRAGAPWMHLEFQLRAMRHIRAWRPEVIHAHSEPESAILGKLIRRPVVLQYDNYFFRSGHGRQLRPLYRRALRGFALLLPCSEYARTESIAYWGLPSERVVVLPNGVNTEDFQPRPAEAQEERDRLGLGERPVILYVGRVCEQKGTDTLLASYRALAGGPRWPALLIAGPIEQFEGAARARSARDWLQEIDAAGAEYLGVVPDARLSALMSAADVFVMPTAELEMQGMAALEAQACGTPVVATNHGGLPDTVPPGCGTLVPVGDHDALSRAVSELLDDPERLSTTGKRSLAHARTLSWPNICDRLEDVYARAVA